MVSNVKNIDACATCKKTRLGVPAKKPLSFVGTVMLVILPKCPFCFMAFGSTAVLCGHGSAVYSSRSFSSPSTIYFTAFFCLLVLASILLNYREARTKYALAIAALGTAMLMLSVIAGGGLLVYYTGLVVVFGGIWLNGSLLFVASRLKETFFKRKKYTNDCSVF